MLEVNYSGKQIVRKVFKPAWFDTLKIEELNLLLKTKDFLFSKTTTSWYGFVFSEKFEGQFDEDGIADFGLDFAAYVFCRFAVLY